MNGLQEKQLQVKRGFKYRYFVSSHYNVSNPTLLLLHGWPDNANLWQYVLPYLSSLNCKIVVPDLLGYAGTDKPTDLEAYNYRLMCQDMLDLLAAEGIEDNVITIGHDFGKYQDTVQTLWFQAYLFQDAGLQLASTCYILSAVLPQYT